MKERTASIDIFRALTMLTMLFVNDFAGMTGIPHFMHHAAADEDMMGFSDLVFPAFLFCVGLSIPLAVRTRYRKGDSHLQVIGHIVLRTIALLVMGVFSMNLKGVEGGLSGGFFTLIAVAAYFLLWNVYPRREGREPVWAKVLKVLGAIILIGLVIYKDCNGMPFKVRWWGILGLIGWSYLACSLAYIFSRGKLRLVQWFWAVSIVLCILNKASFIPEDFSCRAVILGFYPGGWTHVALTASGMLASSLLLRHNEAKADGGNAESRKFIVTMVVLGAAMLVAGAVSHRFWIISKIQATPTWLFYCTAIYFPLFALLYWIADVRGKTAWARPISPAGTATLTCYTLPYILNALHRITGFHYPALLTDGALGLTKAFVYSMVVILLTWALGKCRIKLKI